MSGRKRITEDAVKRALPARTTSFLRDDRQVGFGLRVTPNGAKSFIVEGRVNGRMRRFTVGSAERFTVNEARGKAKKLLADMHDGLDPQLTKKSVRQRSDTLKAMVEAYISAKDLKAATAKQYRALVGRNLADWLEKPVIDITPQMVLLRYEAICRRSISEANGTMRVLRAVCRRAKKALPERADGSALMKVVPTETLSGGWRSLGRKTTLLQPEELPAWWAAVGFLKSDASRRALHSLLLTGLRVSELLGLNWSDFDHANRRLIIRDSKTGAFAKVIGPELASWLGRWRSDDQLTPVFGVYDLRTALARVSLLGGKRITPHDLRRTYLTFGERAGAPMVVLKRLANHSTRGDVTSGYVLPSDTDLRYWAARIEREILSAAHGSAALEALS